MQLDQVLFQQQGFSFRTYHQGLDIINPCHQGLGFGMIQRFDKIAGDPVFQVFGFTHIQ